MAVTIRQVVIDPEASDRGRELAAAFSRKAADHLKADCPSFSYEWFFGACGPDNWGELLPRPNDQPMTDAGAIKN
jgi:hypothetical protein